MRSEGQRRRRTSATRPIPVRREPDWQLRFVVPERQLLGCRHRRMRPRWPANCSPPYLPFPVLAAQLPPDSHCATASQFGLGPAWATAVESDMDAVTSPAAMADLMSGLAILVMLDISPEVAEALPIRESGEIGCLLHRDRPWSAGKGCTTGLIRPAVGPGNTTVLLSSGPVDRGYRGGGTALCRVWRGRVGRRRTARTANSSDSKSATASDYSGVDRRSRCR